MFLTAIYLKLKHIWDHLFYTKPQQYTQVDCRDDISTSDEYPNYNYFY